ncbi:hypothetical protein LEMLEM_LOCUS11928 [Lemmus lemmus]
MTNRTWAGLHRKHRILPQNKEEQIFCILTLEAGTEDGLRHHCDLRQTTTCNPEKNSDSSPACHTHNLMTPGFQIHQENRIKFKYEETMGKGSGSEGEWL